jgi:WD40 repeat protein
MNKKYLAFFSLVIILAFIGYIIYDTIRPARDTQEPVKVTDEAAPPEKWRVSQEIFIHDGLKAIAVSADGNVYLGGNSFVVCYNDKLKETWNLSTQGKITALTVYGDTVFASSEELIYLISKDGKMITEWGPYESKCLITSLSANRNYLAVADAGNKIVFILKKDGEVVSMIGHFGEKFLIPSPYFDVSFTYDNNLFLANTGNFRIEKRTTDGKILYTFGESGTGPAEFCGCCNPAHFAPIPQGFVTAEKGINRIKIMDQEGGFVEYVSSQNDFIPSAPLDVASADGKTIYGANPANGKLYVFMRK